MQPAALNETSRRTTARIAYSKVVQVGSVKGLTDLERNVRCHKQEK